MVKVMLLSGVLFSVLSVNGNYFLFPKHQSEDGRCQYQVWQLKVDDRNCIQY